MVEADRLTAPQPSADESAVAAAAEGGLDSNPMSRNQKFSVCVFDSLVISAH